MSKNIKKNIEKKQIIRLNTKAEILDAINTLKNEYLDARCSLNFRNPLELVVALILAAQCTDNMVNKVVPILFEKYPTVLELSNANINDVQKIIKPCGYYINKSKNIVETANILLTNFNGSVPNTMNELCTLHGIGRKSSNIILQECFNIVEGIAVDTHVTRLSHRIGFTKETIQDKIEKDLIKKIPKKYWDKINHILVFHGRAICTAKTPKCGICLIRDICKRNGI